MALYFFYRELGMLGSPGMDSLSGASDHMKYPGDCYSPKYADQRDTYRGTYVTPIKLKKCQT